MIEATYVLYQEYEAEVIRIKEEAIEAGVAQEHLNAVVAIAIARGVPNAVSADDKYQGNSFDSISTSLPETVVDWAENYRLESHPDRFVAATVYLRERKGMTTVDSNSIMRVYEKARWDKPKNPADVFYRAAKQRYFAETDEENDQEEGLKKWQLTRTGYSHFQSLRKETGNE